MTPCTRPLGNLAALATGLSFRTGVRFPPPPPCKSTTQAYEDGLGFYMPRGTVEEEILYFYRNPESQAFWNQITLFTPDVLREQFWKDIAKRELFYRTQLEALFLQGMEQGIIRKDDPAKLLFSFRAMREGLLNWMIAIPTSEEEWIRAVWKDFWLGFKARPSTEERDEWLDEGFKGKLKKPRLYPGGLGEYSAECLICKKDFQIPFSDFRYKDIKYNRGAYHVCDDCGKMASG